MFGIESNSTRKVISNYKKCVYLVQQLRTFEHPKIITSEYTKTLSVFFSFFFWTMIVAFIFVNKSQEWTGFPAVGGSSNGSKRRRSKWSQLRHLSSRNLQHQLDDGHVLDPVLRQQRSVSFQVLVRKDQPQVLLSCKKHKEESTQL